MKELEALRRKIDLIDVKIVKLLAKRFAAVEKAGRYKQKRGLPPVDEKRWTRLLTGLLKQARTLGLKEGVVKRVYTAIHRAALEEEGRLTGM